MFRVTIAYIHSVLMLTNDLNTVSTSHLYLYALRKKGTKLSLGQYIFKRDTFVPKKSIKEHIST